MTDLSDLRVAPAQVHLPILATSDIHAALLSYNYFADRPGRGGSLARLATAIGAARRQGPAPLLLDNGDFLMGTPLGDMAIEAGDMRDGAVHPVIAAMNHLRYDAAALGNHEFNLDEPDLRAVLGKARFPLLCANLERRAGAPAGYDGLWRPSVMLTHEAVDGAGRSVRLRVGVLGVLPPQVTRWDSLRIAGRLRATDIVATAKTTAAMLRAQGADVVIALAHTGISPEPHVAGMENAALHVAALEDVDAVVAGHVHQVFPGSGYREGGAIDAGAGLLHGCPVVMPGASASHLGRIDLVLEPGTEGGWAVAQARARVIAAAELPEDEDLTALLAPQHARTLARARAPIGRLAAPVHSYFALVSDDRSCRLPAEAMLAWGREVLGAQGLPVLASVAPMKCGGRAGAGHYTDIAAGPMTLAAVADLQFYPNHLSVLRLSGAEIAEWLEMSASLYNRLVPGVAAPQPLFDRDMPAYNREAVYGLSYEIDLTQPARYGADGGLRDGTARRVRDLRHDGAPVAPERAFLLVTNDYRAGGGGSYPCTGAERAVSVPPTAMRDLMRAHLGVGQGRTDPGVPGWRFAAVPGVVASFETGAGALEADWPEGLALSALGPSEDGFCRFALRMG